MGKKDEVVLKNKNLIFTFIVEMHQKMNKKQMGLQK